MQYSPFSVPYMIQFSLDRLEERRYNIENGGDEMNEALWVSVVVSVVLIAGIMTVFLAPIYISRKKKRERDRLFGTGEIPDRNFRADYTAEHIISIDYRRRKIRPELYENCRTIPFSKLAAVQIIRDSEVYYQYKLRGATLNTFIGGALWGTPGAILGACSGTPTVRRYEDFHGWKLVLYTRIPGAERLEIPIGKRKKTAVTGHGSRRILKGQDLVDELRHELENLEFEADLDDPDFV